MVIITKNGVKKTLKSQWFYVSFSVVLINHLDQVMHPIKPRWIPDKAPIAMGFSEGFPWTFWVKSYEFQDIDSCLNIIPAKLSKDQGHPIFFYKIIISMAAMAAMPGWSSLRHPDARCLPSYLLPQDGILPVARPRNTSFESKQGPKRSRKWVGGSRGKVFDVTKIWKKHVCNWDERAAWEVLVSACLSLSSAPVACGGFMMASKKKQDQIRI